MTNRRFEMYELRQVLVRMRLGDSDRALAKSGLIGRPKAKALRQLAESGSAACPKTHHRQRQVRDYPRLWPRSRGRPITQPHRSFAAVYSSNQPCICSSLKLAFSWSRNSSSRELSQATSFITILIFGSITSIRSRPS